MRALDITKLFVFLFLLVIDTSCMDKPSKKNTSIYQVKLAFAPDFYKESRIDTVEFSKPQIKDTTKYDNELINYVGHQFFKVEEGEMKISALSLFERAYLKTVNINSDTTIIFTKKDFPIVFEKPDYWDEDLDLKKNDTIVICYFNGGCYVTDDYISERKISFYKKDTNYIVKFSDLPLGKADNKSAYKTKVINRNIGKELCQFYKAAKKIKGIRNDSYSTSSTNMIIRVDNKILRISESNISFQTKHEFFISGLYINLLKLINGS